MADEPAAPGMLVGAVVGLSRNHNGLVFHSVPRAASLAVAMRI